MPRNSENKLWLGGSFGIIICLLLMNLIRADATWQPEIKVPACEIAENNYFGHCVATDGDYVIVGALYSDGSEPECGSAYILWYDGEGWVEQDKLTASDGAAYDNFGHSVSISGDYAIVGAPDNNDFRGSAYIFKRDGTSWQQQAKLTAPDAVVYDLFGFSVSIRGDYALVGARFSDSNAIASGSAYVFKRDGEDWLEQAKLTASDGAFGDNFGISVSINGGQAIIGAPCNDSGKTDSGAAYIFEQQGEDWLQQAKLTASDGRTSDCFGNSVSISGNRAIAAAVLDDYKGVKIKNCGSVYVFNKPAGGWADATETAKITASDADVDDRFGESVSICANYIVAGAVYDDDKGGQSGSAYVFRHDGTNWARQAKLTASDGGYYDHFGVSVCISNTRMIVGSVLDDSDGIRNCGSAYTYEKICPTADLSGDCFVNFEDFALFTMQWLRTGCDQTNWCDGADFDQSSEVDGADLDEFTSQWLQY